MIKVLYLYKLISIPMMTTILLSTGALGPFELLIILLPIVLWGYVVFDVLTSSFKESTDKVVWLLAVLLIPVLGVVLYYTLGRKRLAELQ